MSSRTPFDELERMFERMSRQFDRAASELGAELEPYVSDDVRVDLADRGEAFVLTADLPGFHADDVDLRVDGSRVHLEATRSEASETSRGGETPEAETPEGTTDASEPTFLRRERRRRSVSRTVSLPEPVDEKAVDASYRNGVLTVTLPKRSEDGTGRSIDIE